MLASIPTMSAQSDENYQVIAEKASFEKDSFYLAESLIDFDTVTFELDPNKFNEAVNNKGNVVLTLEGEDLELELYETYVMRKDPKVIVEDESGIHFIDAPYFHTYHGKVVGKEGSRVAITTYDDIFIGMIDIDDNPYYVELTKGMVNDKTVHAIYRKNSRVKDPAAKPAHCGVENEDMGVTNLFSFEKTATLSSRSTTQIDILPCYDRDFKDIYGSYTAAEGDITNMINEVNMEFANQSVQLTFNYYKKYGYLDDNTSQGILDFFKEDIPLYMDITDSDLATLFYGDEFINETVIGRGSVYNGSSERAYSVVQMVEEPNTQYDADYDERCRLLGHELGHNFGASHDEAYNWTTPSMNYFTLMWTPFYFNSTHQLKQIYSDGNVYGDQNHNNSEYIIDHKATIAAFRTS